MGSAQSSYVTPETALTALVVVGAVALGYNHIPTTPKDATAAAGPATESSASQKKGKKVKGKDKAPDTEPASAAAAPAQDTAAPGSVAASGSLPGQFDADSTPANGASKKNKKKGKKNATATTTPGGSTASLPQSVSASIDFLNASEIQLASPKSADEGESAGKKKKKAKGKAATPSAVSPSTSQTLTPAQPPPTASSKDDKPKQKQTKDTKTTKAQPAPTLAGPTASTTSLDTDGSWTRVGAPRRGKGAASAEISAEVSAAEQTTPSGTGTSSPVVSRSGADDASLEEEEDDEDEEAKPGEEREFLLSAAARASGETRKTLAERLVPKPRKTHVEDMLTTPDYPTLARVVRVRPRPDEKPAHGFTWGDYEDVRTGDDADAEGDGGRPAGGSAAENDDADDDDGWGVVTGRKNKRLPSGTASTPAHKATKAPETLTKKQRQNQQRRDEAKAARDAGEAERLAALERHKRQLEGERIKAQFGAEGKGKKGRESGGMVASVDDKGRLVWE